VLFCSKINDVIIDSGKKKMTAISSKNTTGVKLNYESEIKRLKHELNAVILAHYYQESEIQDIADFVGDSLELAKRAAQTTADVIVFAGVHFMAETAKILNPSKQVLLPDVKAGCSLAESAPTEEFRKFREEHPDHMVITYINCTAEVKALSDIICTSSSAETIIRKIPPGKPIIFAPDRNLGAYLNKKTGRDMLLWQGTCIVHEAYSERRIRQCKLENPKAKLIAHPECEEIVLAQADFIGSTSALLKYVQASQDKEFIVATEPGIIHQMEKTSQGKKFIEAPQDESCACSVCPHMKLNTMEKLYLCMKNRTPEIIMDEDLRKRALIPIQRMMEMTA
jgi:quinolinate synthase